MNAIRVLGREIWFALTLLSGKLDERTAEGMNDELFSFSMLFLTTLASLFILFTLTGICVYFEIG